MEDRIPITTIVSLVLLGGFLLIFWKIKDLFVKPEPDLKDVLMSGIIEKRDASKASIPQKPW